MERGAPPGTGIELTPYKDSIIEWSMQKIASADDIYVFDYDELVDKFPDYYQFQLPEFKKEGYKESLAGRLKVGDKVLGMFCMNALKKGHFKKRTVRAVQERHGSTVGLHFEHSCQR